MISQEKLNERVQKQEASLSKYKDLVKKAKQEAASWAKKAASIKDINRISKFYKWGQKHRIEVGGISMTVYDFFLLDTFGKIVKPEWED